MGCSEYCHTLPQVPIYLYFGGFDEIHQNVGTYWALTISGVTLTTKRSRRVYKELARRIQCHLVSQIRNFNVINTWFWHFAADSYKSGTLLILWSLKCLLLCSYVPDIPIHSVEVLPVTRSTTGRAVWPRDRHVVAGLHTRWDAHWWASVQWRQRGRSDEQNRRGSRHAAWSFVRPGEIV